MTALLVFLLATVPTQDSDPEKLKEFEKTLEKEKRPPQETKKPDKPKKQESSCWDDDDESLEDVIFGSVVRVIFEFLSLPFKYAFSDQDMRFDDYPYAHGRRYFQVEPTSAKPVAFDVALAYGRIEHDLWSLDLGGTVRWASGCDFHFDITHFEEDVDNGTDRLTLQQYGLNFGGQGRARSFQLSFGFGLAVLNGENVTDFGPLIQADMIHFPVKPLSLRLHAGMMSFSSATITDLRAEVGIHWDRFAVTAGIRSLISSGGEDLTGPTLGFAVFF